MIAMMIKILPNILLNKRASFKKMIPTITLVIGSDRLNRAHNLLPSFLEPN